MTSGFFHGDLFRGLAIRVLFFLSLALLPIGLIAVSQTQQIAEQNRNNAELSLIALSELASQAEAEMLQQAFASADALSSILSLVREDSARCSEFIAAYRDANPDYSFVGFIGLDGVMVCSSTAQTYDFSDSAHFAESMERPSRRVRSVESGAISSGPVTNVTSPVMEDGDLVGLLSISIPWESFRRFKAPDIAQPPIATITFNQKGDAVTAKKALDEASAEMPADVALRAFVGGDATVFTAENMNGVPRVYATRPIVKDTVYAVSVWPINTPFLNPSIVSRLGTLVPIIMWAASLIVAFWALNRLAIRHIRKLVRQMRRFGLNRGVPRETLDPSVPAELVDLERAFISMAEGVLQDEATLEDSIREKNILLKEVHHRVKNNLQLISSIMNMQIRQAKTEDASFVLKRLQERILSLATVHKNLYQNDNLARVDAEVLMTEVVDQLLTVGIVSEANVKITKSFKSISLDADDAAPLTLLVSEALTNALKYLPQDKGADAELIILLESEGEDHARFKLVNSTGAHPEEESTGLGSRLIHAFSRQLNGQIVITETDDTYCLEVVFPVPRAPKQTLDY